MIAHGDGSTITVASGIDVNFINPGFAGRTLTAEAALVSQAGLLSFTPRLVTQLGCETVGGTFSCLQTAGR